MASYYLNEAVLDLPERAFLDKTIHGLESKLPSGGTLCVFVHRRMIEGDKPLRDLVDENVALNTKRLGGFTVLDDAPSVVGGAPGLVLRTRWRREGTTFYQVQAHVVFEEKWMIFAVSGPIDDRSVCDETFGAIVATLAWRSD